ncbi:transmembrane and coiled-coil domain-containing protein 3 isoform X1 [Trachypithecus francoisi]|uniref:transmembrane and coiled-coil domain-containing protein 3 isoform X1 n=1 Tax=Trachypithecus francoisi TaxID=54180 RepID=UPI00141B3145|nr:transmembrane and coiled-coil domain-containing protein 3 isoform X1 [Trachypithecus francoisi]
MKVLGRSFFWVLFPVLPWAVQPVEHEEVAQRVIKLHRGRGATATQSRQWVRDSCRKLSGLLRQKNAVLNKLKNAIGAVEKDMGLSDEEKLFQVHTFEIFQKELNESENSVFQAIYGLQRALQGDYKDVVNMKESSRQRLEALREAAIKEETEYMELLAAEKHQVEALKNMQHQNQSLSMLDEILEDVRKAADRLEEEIEEHAFDDNKSVKGVNFEAVLRVEEEEANSKQNITKRDVEDDLGLSMLIDSQNNQYILTKPRDSTIPRADHHFIKDIVTIGMLSLPCGWLCTAIGLPTMFGYIICGVLLGPSGLNSIKSIVQVETLGEFGVFFTLFLVGLEFSPEKLRKVWKISLQGPCYMTLLMIAFGLLWGHLLRIKPTQSVFISTCLSLSSTPLVSRFLVGSARADKEGDIDYSTVLLGMLVTQDVQLGLFMAIMPTLIQAGASASSSIVMEVLRILVLIGQILFSLAAVFLLCLVIKKYLIGPYYRKLHVESKGNKEILILGVSAFIFLMLTVTELLDVSMELGCFLAGALVSSQGPMVTEEIAASIEPIRDFLAIVFFASIVSPGGAGPVSHSAEEQPIHQVDRLRGACPGQRVFLCPGEPGTKSGRHLSGGVPPYTECDHAQPLTRPGAVESCNHEVCAQTRETVQPLMHGVDGPWKGSVCGECALKWPAAAASGKLAPWQQNSSLAKCRCNHVILAFTEYSCPILEFSRVVYLQSVDYVQ